MKKHFLLLFIVAAFITSCSSDDSSNSTDNSFVYLPLTSGSNWDYEITTANQPSIFDDLYVGDEIVLNGKTYKQMKNIEIPTGLYCSILRDNALRNEGSKTFFTGDLSLNLGINLPIDLAVEDFLMLDHSAPSNQVLGSQSGIIQQNFEGVPLTITYTFKVTAQENLPNYVTPNNVTYSDVKKVKMTLALQLVTVQSIPGTTVTIPITILNTQDVVTATQFYAKGIGMVYANDVISYNLAIDPATFNLDIPQSGSQIVTETLTTYTIN
ncbi:hypothetical protein [Flavobacterium sp. UBA6135]|uniref:hypothetical protein n=1 Tax=Flavobacterium sp. UBA6135 TaxID=1946553 RepID=UPI0025C1F9EC|nr:hypothetical protein [Flavobacterium sp. UBA6135]